MFQFSRCSKKTVEGANDAATHDFAEPTKTTNGETTMTLSAKNISISKPVATKIKPIAVYELSSDSEDEIKDSELRRKTRDAEKDKLRQTLQNAKMNLSSKGSVKVSDKPSALKTVVRQCLDEISDHKNITVRQVMRMIAQRMKTPELPAETKAEARLLLIELREEQNAFSTKSTRGSISPAGDKLTDHKTNCDERTPDNTRETPMIDAAMEKTTKATISKVAKPIDADLKVVVQECLKEVPDPSKITVGQVMRKIADRLKLRTLPAETKAAAKHYLIELLQDRKTTRKRQKKSVVRETSTKDSTKKEDRKTEPKPHDQAQKTKSKVNALIDSAGTSGIQCVEPSETVTTYVPKVAVPSARDDISKDGNEVDANSSKSTPIHTDQGKNILKCDESPMDLVDPKEKPFKATKTKSKRKAAPERDSEDVSPLQKALPKKKPCKPSTKVSVKNSKTQATQEDAMVEPSPPLNKRKGSSKRCRYCKECSCQTAKVPKTLGTHSSVAIEKALIKRLVQLESTADHYESQTDAVRRQLQKHRRNLYQRRMKLLSKNTNEREQQTIFILPDVDVLEQKFNSMTSKPQKAPKDAKERLFASVAAPQRTLTQLVGGDTVDVGTELKVDESLELVQTAEPMVNFTETADENLIDFAMEDEAALSSAPANVERRDPNHHASVWNAGRRGCLQTEWDDSLLQQLDNSEADDAMGQLVGLFGTPETPSKESSNSERTSPSNLSARAKRLTDDIVNEVQGDEAKMRAVELGCTDWKENIQFVMAQRESQDLHGALSNVRYAKQQLAKQKTRIMEFLDQRSSTLELFENTLERSLVRLAQQDTSESFSGT